MISRHWRGIAKKADADRYVSHLRTDRSGAFQDTGLPGLNNSAPSHSRGSRISDRHEMEVD